MITLELPLWMVERIVQILSEHPYTGCEEIVQRIKEQAKKNEKRHHFREVKKMMTHIRRRKYEHDCKAAPGNPGNVHRW